MILVDIAIVGLILFGGILGYKRGFTIALIKAIDMIVVVVLAFLLKGYVSEFLYNNLPFLEFGLFKNIDILNILFYEFIAFLILVIVFSIIVKLLLKAFELFEKLLKATVILSIPSKIIGFIIGLLHYYLIVFIILMLTMTFVNFNSNLSNRIVTETPVLTNLFNSSVSVVKEFTNLKESFDDSSISEEKFNYDAMNLFLKYDIISIHSFEGLLENEKITNFNGYNDLIEKYKGE